MAAHKKPAGLPPKIGQKKKDKRGGRREGAGRKKGSRNKSTTEFENFVQAAIAKAKPKEGQLGSLEFFQAIYRDETVPFRIRAEAAAKCMAFESPRLQATEVTGKDGGPIEHRVTAAKASLRRKLLNKLHTTAQAAAADDEEKKEE